MLFRSYIINALITLFFVRSSSAEVSAGPVGTHSGRWSSLVINSGLGNVLHIARNSPGQVTQNGLFEVWEYVNTAGNLFTLVASKHINSISVEVCHLADEAFNALTGSSGHQFERVAVQLADGLTLFAVNGSPDEEFAFSLSNSSVTKGDVDARSIHTPRCRNIKRGEALDITSAEDLERAANEYDANPDYSSSKRGADAQQTYVVGYTGFGCTGAEAYVLRENLFDHCHRTTWNQAVSFTVVNPRAGPGHAHVCADEHCNNPLGIITTQECFPAGEYGSIHRRE